MAADNENTVANSAVPAPEQRNGASENNQKNSRNGGGRGANPKQRGGKGKGDRGRAEWR